MNNVPRNTLNATETSCATVQRNTIYELLRTKLSEKYAKQTQFPKDQNELNFVLHKGLQKSYPAGGAKKQTQFKPNQTQFPKSQNERKLNYNKGLQKKR